ncbi:MAG: response regulator transcription factor [Dehalococcoidia bacterium]
MTAEASMDTTIRVLVVAAYPALRAGLRALLEGADDLVVVGAVSAAEVEAAPAADLALIDLGDGGASVSAIAAGVAALMPIVALAGRPSDFGDLATAATPRGLLLSDAGADEIVAAVRAVSRGLVVLDPTAALSVLERPAVSVRVLSGEQVDALTDREREVLGLLSLGLPNKAIALRLGISDHTVKFHVGAILAKLGAAGRTEAVMVAARRGILAL